MMSLPRSTSCFVAIITCAVFLGTSQSAHAGGCQRQPRPGDYLNCNLNGPYGPSGPNNVECRSQCTALRDCLNNPPAGGCAAQQTALNECVANGTFGLDSSGGGMASGSSSVSVVTVSYDSSAGCVLVGSGTVAREQLEEISNYLETDPTEASSGYYASAAYSDSECLIAEDLAIEVDGSHRNVVIELLSSKLGVEKARLGDQADLYADLGASWEDMRAVANDFGKLFRVKVQDEVVNNLNTVEDVVRCVQNASLGGVR